MYDKPWDSIFHDSITLSSHNIPFCDSARNLGVILDSELFMKKHVIKICQTAYFEYKCISSIRRFLAEDALVRSYVLSRLDYCNCHLMVAPNSVVQPLPKVQNFAAGPILMAPRQHFTHLLKKLHRLSISERIEYKVACMCSHAINGSRITYLFELPPVVSHASLFF